jgi:hypothetical protein
MSVPPSIAIFGESFLVSLFLCLAFLSGSHRSPLLEALPAKYRPPLCWPEGNCRLFPALRTVRLRFRSYLRSTTTASATFSALGLASFASFGFVLETLVGEKHLFAARKYKLSATLRALQNPIVVFHEPLPLRPSRGRGWAEIAP